MSLFSSAEAANYPCENSSNQLTITSNYIKTRFETEDVSIEIAQAEKLVKECHIDISKFGWGNGIFEFWKKQNKEFLYKNSKEQIEHNAKYRKILPSEIENYKSYAARMGIDSKTINTFIETHNSQGIQSSLKEQKSCSPKIDLRSNILGPVRDQDTVGWCYAFAASDLLTYKLKKTISAADLAINYNNTWINYMLNKLGDGEQDFIGGWEDDAINGIAKKGGACLEKNLRSEDNGYALLKKTLEDLDKLKTNNGKYTNINCSQAAHAMFPSIKTAEYLNIIDNSSKVEFMALLSDKTCEPRISLKGIKAKKMSAIFESGSNQLCDQIDNQLNAKNIVSIGYNAKSLYNIDAKETSLHASVVVGRRFNSTNGECEYLIRNSWGRGCSRYDYRLKCEEGNIWMPKSVLVKGLKDVTYLQ